MIEQASHRYWQYVARIFPEFCPSCRCVTLNRHIRRTNFPPFSLSFFSTFSTLWTDKTQSRRLFTTVFTFGSKWIRSPGCSRWTHHTGLWLQSLIRRSPCRRSEGNPRSCRTTERLSGQADICSDSPATCPRGLLMGERDRKPHPHYSFLFFSFTSAVGNLWPPIRGQDCNRCTWSRYVRGMRIDEILRGRV